jgi:hypothetical protein
MHALLVAIAVAACGRVDFDATSTAGDGGIGDGASGGFVISSTQLGPATGFSYVDLEVDWTRSLAYVGTREAGQCFAVIDFAATPTVIAREGPPMTSGTVCLGIYLEPGGTKLVVTSEAANTIERWDLGTDPHAASYTQLTSVALTGPRRIAPSLMNPATVYVSRNSLAPGVQQVSLAVGAPWLAVGPSFDSTLSCVKSVDSTVDLATGVVLSPCADNTSPVEVADDLAMSKLGQINAVPTSGSSGFWTSAATADGKIGAALGWVGVIVDARGPTAFTMLARFQLTDPNDAYRDARFFGQTIFGVRDSGAIDAISLTTPTDPVVVGSGSLGAAGAGAYAIEVSPDGTRAIVVTNHGYFFELDLTQLPPTSMRWPAF